MSFPSPYYRWRPHPWHGLSVGPNPPSIVYGYIELTPFDLVKYEIDKETGYMMVDRPQRSSNQPPALYGFIPRTYCGSRVRDLMPAASKGDGDPLDICVITERPINRAEVILKCRVIGGLPMIDDDEADYKIIAVMENDAYYAGVNDLSEIPAILVERMHHYFLTYKYIPGSNEHKVSIGEHHNRKQALEMISAAMEDYDMEFGM